VAGYNVDCFSVRTSLRMRTRNPWMPSLRPPIRSCAKTTAHLACTAELVIQYFCASVVGVWIMNSSAAWSNCAVVCISTALLPALPQVHADHGYSNPIDLLKFHLFTELRELAGSMVRHVSRRMHTMNQEKILF
jgi:hypothetical protein